MARQAGGAARPTRGGGRKRPARGYVGARRPAGTESRSRPGRTVGNAGPGDGRPTPGRRARRGQTDPLAGGAEYTRAVGPASDAVLMMQGEHRTLAVALERAGKDPRATARLRRLLEDHLEAEEAEVYPALASAGVGAAVLETARARHDRLRRLVGRLSSGRTTSDPASRAALRDLRAALEEHVAAEEGPVFAEALARIPRPERLAIATRIECRRQGAA